VVSFRTLEAAASSVATAALAGALDTSLARLMDQCKPFSGFKRVNCTDQYTLGNVFLGSNDECSNYCSMMWCLLRSGSMAAVSN